MTLTARSWSEDQIMYFLVNASSPKSIDVATSNLYLFRSHEDEGTGQHFV